MKIKLLKNINTTKSLIKSISIDKQLEMNIIISLTDGQILKIVGKNMIHFSCKKWDVIDNLYLTKEEVSIIEDLLIKIFDRALLHKCPQGIYEKLQKNVDKKN